MKYEQLGKALVDSIRRCSEGRTVGVAFSGGIDSGLVAAVAREYARSVTLYTCGTDDSFDVAKGRELAEKLDLPWVHCRIGPETIERDVREFIQATKVSDPFTISYDLQLFTVCRTSPDPVILTGQGSDELFGGCARTVSDDESEYHRVMGWGVERLYKVSIPCEQSIAKHFRKKLFYPYLDESVVSSVASIPDDDIRPLSLDDRKAVLRETVSDLGYPVLSSRVKKASQYGSGTTELIRKAAAAKGVRFNRFISDIYESMGFRDANLLRDSVVDVRVDPILLYDAERILKESGLTHSQAVAKFYSRMVKDGGLGFLEKNE